MNVLVINCGSSSIKYKLINLHNSRTLATGVVEKVGMKGSFLKHEKEDGTKIKLEGEILEHSLGIEYILGVLLSKNHGCIENIEEIGAVGHRVVHGGEKFNGSVLITDEMIAEMEACIELAPLHNPPNLKGIYAMKELLPGVPQVGVFDTAFHQTMPDYAFMYAIPYSLYKKYGVRRYGFHGTSHRYVSQRACDVLGVDYQTQKIITCHMGNGVSLAAIKNGISVDTSMGFTPVEGLMMGTRCGDLDVGAALFIMEKETIGNKSATTLFNKHSGLLGVSGVSSDSRDIEAAAYEDNNERAQLALKMFQYRVKKYIGSYIAAMGGLDILIFTGGIGENSSIDRLEICKDMEFLQITIDEEINNNARGKEIVISKAGMNVKVMVVPTDEELMIAKDTQEIISEL